VGGSHGPHRAVNLSPGAVEEWAVNKDVELILILKGHNKLQTYNFMDSYCIDVINAH
jgi:hypothetical protein